MRLIDVVSAPWAITPEMFQEVQGIYARHMRGEKIDIAKLEAAVGGKLNNTRQDVQVSDGVAVISLDGVLAKRANLFMQISGGTSMQIALAQLRQAVADPQVTAIVLYIDSPGGTVDGTTELADAVFAARDSKPIVTVADGVMASAAYWIGSAASKAFISGPTTVVGSIGVVSTHVDYSRYEKNAGIDAIEITAGKYKRLETEGGTLTREGRQVMQAQVDQLYGIFVDAVARNRGAAVEEVLTNMADGRVFIGDKAIEAGLVDGVATLTDIIARAAAGEFQQAADPATQDGGVPAVVANLEIVPMNPTVESVKKEHPEVANALIAEGRKAAETDAAAASAAAREAGAKSERERIKGVFDQSMAGHETLVMTLALDGKTTGPEAALQIVKAEKVKGGQQLVDLKDDAAGARVTPTNGDTPTPAAATKVYDPNAVAMKARAYKDAQLALGNEISDAEAVDHILKESGNVR
jgi:signal peptide peptidase SppA